MFAFALKCYIVLIKHRMLFLLNHQRKNWLLRFAKRIFLLHLVTLFGTSPFSLNKTKAAHLFSKGVFWHPLVARHRTGENDS